ncbi:probable G-protein coupled receptor [Cynoglossus semilaevis]|uniref:Si:ch211-213o11.11 n=1 Tax=Cynoglossus semilaevis TaxID=244447 RepID=A0A3P8UKX9_CYNSE|nr:probable G-protein coupled receptor [Cynoglossus semilaevis]
MEENSSVPIPDNSTAVPMPSADNTYFGVILNSQLHLKDLTGIFLMVTVNVVALVANTAVLVVVIKAPHLRRLIFVCHLCAVDLLCAVLLLPLGIVSSSPLLVGVELTLLECQIYVFFNVVLTAASIFTITAISVERYYYIVHPMHYEVKMTLKLTAVVMASVWLVSLALGLSSLFGWPALGGLSAACAAHGLWHRGHSDHRRIFSLLFSIVCFFLPAVVIFAVYCSVYRVARVAARQHGPVPSWTNNQLKQRSDSINSQITIITTSNAPRRTLRDRPFGGKKAALTLVVIVGQFLICWLPYFVFHLHLTLQAQTSVRRDLEQAVTWLAYSSFAVNPFLYGLLNRQIREELCKIVRCCYSTRPVEVVICSPGVSGHENFLQFLHRTSSTLETQTSFVTSSPRSTLDQTGFRIPGQIPEEYG